MASVPSIWLVADENRRGRIGALHAFGSGVFRRACPSVPRWLLQARPERVVSAGEAKEAIPGVVAGLPPPTSSLSLVLALTTARMSTFELWLTPSITLSLILESESPAPSFIRWASSWLLYFRPALLKQALAYELEQRPEQDVVSAGTLRIVDYACFRTTTAEVSFEVTSCCLGRLARAESLQPIPLRSPSPESSRMPLTLLCSPPPHLDFRREVVCTGQRILTRSAWALPRRRASRCHH